VTTKLPQADTVISFCHLCRKYHGFETWCLFNLACMAGRGLIWTVAFIGAAYGLFIEWYVKIMLVALISALIYIAFVTVTGFDPVPRLLRSVQK
jgi:hypothetical protein